MVREEAVSASESASGGFPRAGRTRLWNPVGVDFEGNSRWPPLEESPERRQHCNDGYSTGDHTITAGDFGRQPGAASCARSPAPHLRMGKRSAGAACGRHEKTHGVFDGKSRRRRRGEFAASQMPDQAEMSRRFEFVKAPIDSSAFRAGFLRGGPFRRPCGIRLRRRPRRHSHRGISDSLASVGGVRRRRVCRRCFCRGV